MLDPLYVRRLARRICGTTLPFFCLEAFVEWEDSNLIGDWGASDWRPRCPPTRILNFLLALHKRRKWTNLPELLTFGPPPRILYFLLPLIQSSCDVVIVPPTNHSDIP
ncbi:hypothetical protein Syun_009481 [Stephania yunnanensis]|uniref:Uncharacterized protein n=1 Tax=Stephania yunnanensis TaxID=152371 RepID=A0AAP0KH28_9MAGN